MNNPLFALPDTSGLFSQDARLVGRDGWTVRRWFTAAAGRSGNRQSGVEGRGDARAILAYRTSPDCARRGRAFPVGIG